LLILAYNYVIRGLKLILSHAISIGDLMAEISLKMTLRLEIFSSNKSILGILALAPFKRGLSPLG